MINTIKTYFSNQYLQALVFFIILFLIIRLVLYIFGKLTLKLKKNKKSENKILKRFSKTLTILAILIAIPFSLRFLTIEEQILSTINKILYSLISLAIAFFFYFIMDAFLLKIIKRINKEEGLGESLQSIIRGTTKIVLLLLAIVYILVIWGLEIGPLLAGFGIAGLALALALQPTLGNLFSGISLILDETFKVGDVIKLDSGELGSVYQVGIRTTKIKTFDNEMVIIPNSKIANSILQNFYQPDKSIRVGVEFGVEYGTDPEHIKKIVLEEVNKISFIDKEQEPRILFTEMGDSALKFKTMFWVDDISKKWPAHQEAISRIYRRLYKEKIGIPFPQRTVWLRDEGKAKSPSPKDKKFNKTKGKYFSNFGYEYEEESSDKKSEKSKK